MCRELSLRYWRIDDAEPHLSVASLWEIAIKIRLGKLGLDPPTQRFASHS